MAIQGDIPPKYGFVYESIYTYIIYTYIIYTYIIHIYLYIYISIYIYTYTPEIAIDDMTKGIKKEVANEHCSEPL